MDLSKMEAVDRETYRSIMRRYASGVVVVTTAGDGWVHGSTAQAFISVSLNPPIVLLSLSRDGRTYSRVKESGVFGVTILSEDQRWIADRFADPNLDSEQRFSGVDYFRGVTGSPIIRGGCGYLEATVYGLFDVVDHGLVLGKVVDGKQGLAEARPLVYYNRDYRSLRL
jgi:flavin reductase (DIM6/NTAB) family NADH-FMN oxidoreductase RutF